MKFTFTDKKVNIPNRVHTDDGGAGTDGDLQVVPTLFHAEDDGGLGLGLEVAV